MFKLIRRLFVRPSIQELLADELYETKVTALEAAKQAEYWAAMHRTLTGRVTRLEGTMRDQAELAQRSLPA